MDAFIEAAEAARRRLIRAEGQDVSWREVIRRAGWSESERARVAYHLNTTKQWPKGHNVPADIVAGLARGLQVPEQDLARAARIAAGFNVVEEVPNTDAVSAVLRFYGQDDVTDEEKAEVTNRLLQIIAEEGWRSRHDGD